MSNRYKRFFRVKIYDCLIFITKSFLLVTVLPLFPALLSQAAPVIKPDNSLARRPLTTVHKTVPYALRTKRAPENILGTLHYCNGARIFIEQKDQDAEVVGIYINGIYYSPPDVPYGSHYALAPFQVEEIGYTHRKGIVIDTNAFNLPQNSSVSFTYPLDPNHRNFRFETILLRKDSFDADKSASDYLCNTHIEGTGIDFSEGATAFLAHKSELIAHPGTPIPLQGSHYYSQGLYLNHDTGFDLSGLEKTEVLDGVIVFLDQNMGDISINGTITPPNLESSYNIAFYGIHTGTSSDHQTPLNLEESPARIIQQSNEDTPLIDCQQNHQCAIYNLDFQSDDGRELKKLVQAPPDNFVYHIYTTQNNNTETVVLYNNHLHHNHVTVYTSNADASTLRKNACKVCNNRLLNSCSAEISCYGGSHPTCPEAVVFHGRPIDCSSSPATTTSTASPASTASNPVNNPLETSTLITGMAAGEITTAFLTSGNTVATTTGFAAGSTATLTITGIVIGTCVLLTACAATYAAVYIASNKYGCKNSVTRRWNPNENCVEMTQNNSADSPKD